VEGREGGVVGSMIGTTKTEVVRELRGNQHQRSEKVVTG